MAVWLWLANRIVEFLSLLLGCSIVERLAAAAVRPQSRLFFQQRQVNEEEGGNEDASRWKPAEKNLEDDSIDT